MYYLRMEFKTTIGIVLCSEKNETMVKYSVLNENDHLYASKYKLYIPSEEELKKEIEQKQSMQNDMVLFGAAYSNSAFLWWKEFKGEYLGSPPSQRPHTHTPTIPYLTALKSTRIIISSHLAVKFAATRAEKIL